MKRPSQRSREGVIAIITNPVPIFPQAKRKFKMDNLVSLCFDIVFFIVYFCLGALGFWLFGGSQ